MKGPETRQAIAPGWRKRVQSIWQLVRSRPYIVLVPLAVLGLMIGLGIWAVENGANATAQNSR